MDTIDKSIDWPKTVATHFHAQLGIPDKGRPIKGLVFRRPIKLMNMILHSIKKIWFRDTLK